MMILHLIPVGLSLLDRIGQGALPALQPALAADELPGSADTVTEALRHASGRNLELDLNYLGLTDVPRMTRDADPSMAAEWTSVSAMAAERHPGVVNGEAYVFVATDTDDGLRAATLLAVRYQSTIRYLDEPLTAGRPVLEPGDVYICRIPHLNLGFVQPDDVTWRSLGAAGRMAADTTTQTGRGEWDVIVHLSGGYKAMIPYLMVLAEGIHSRLRDLPSDAPHRPSIRAVAIHESTLPAEAPIVIDTSIRAIEGDLLADARRLVAATPPHSDIVDAGVAEDLMGLFIERVSEQKRRLTPAGLIMVNVL